MQLPIQGRWELGSTLEPCSGTRGLQRWSVCWACSSLLPHRARAARQACALQVGGQTVAGVQIGASSMASTTSFSIEGVRVSPRRPAGQIRRLTLMIAGLD